MGRIIFATGNQDKLKEIREIMSGAGFEIISMKEAGVEAEICEDGTTFEENAFIKARAVYAAVKAGAYDHGKWDFDEGDVIVLADDSGLVVDALGGAPGVHSSRFMGEETSYRVKNAKIIEMLDGVPDEKRTARFVCVTAAVMPGGKELAARGVMEGIIAGEEKGGEGFGYDPIFFLPELGCTSAEIPMEDKNAISHRGKALRAMRRLIEGGA